MRSRVEFVAVVAPADANPTLSFPVCTATEPELSITALAGRAVGGQRGRVRPEQHRGQPPGQTFAWDFGDGETSTGEFPAHTFAQSGTHVVTLTVDGSTGTQTAQHARGRAEHRADDRVRGSRR